MHSLPCLLLPLLLTNPLPAQESTVEEVVVGLQPVATDERNPGEVLFARLQDTALRMQRRVVALTIHPARGPDGKEAAPLFANGFLLDRAGHVMTHDAVLTSADRVIARLVNMPDLRPRRAFVVGVDAETSVGLLTIGDLPLDDLGQLPMLAAPDPPREGQVVVTLGSLDTLAPWTSVGHVETALENMNFGGRRYPELWRISVEMHAISPGGVVVQNGQVAGMVVSHWNPAPDGPGVGLVIPIQWVQKGVARLLAKAAQEPLPHPAGTRPWIGVSCTEIEDPALRWHLGVTSGVMVFDVIHDSPAEAAGLDRYDVLVRWNGDPILDLPHFRDLVASGKSGEAVTLEVIQKGEARQLGVTLSSW